MSPGPHGDYPHLLLLYHWSCVIIRVVYFGFFPESFFGLIIVTENIAFKVAPKLACISIKFNIFMSEQLKNFAVLVQISCLLS